MRKKIILFFATGILLNAFFQLVQACGREQQISLDDDKLASQYMSHFLLICAKNPDEVYRMPIKDESKLLLITSRVPGVPQERYQLINFMSDENMVSEHASEPVCWWLMIPASFSYFFENLQGVLSYMMTQIELEKIKNKNSTKISKHLQELENNWDELLQETLKSWKARDHYKHVFKDKNHGIEVNFLEIFHEPLKKVIYLGVSTTLPSWMSESLSINPPF